MSEFSVNVSEKVTVELHIGLAKKRSPYLGRIAFFFLFHVDYLGLMMHPDHRYCP